MRSEPRSRSNSSKEPTPRWKPDLYVFWLNTTACGLGFTDRLRLRSSTSSTVCASAGGTCTRVSVCTMPASENSLRVPASTVDAGCATSTSTVALPSTSPTTRPPEKPNEAGTSAGSARPSSTSVCSTVTLRTPSGRCQSLARNASKMISTPLNSSLPPNVSTSCGRAAPPDPVSGPTVACSWHSTPTVSPCRPPTSSTSAASDTRSRSVMDQSTPSAPFSVNSCVSNPKLPVNAACSMCAHRRTGASTPVVLACANSLMPSITDTVWSPHANEYGTSCAKSVSTTAPDASGMASNSFTSGNTEENLNASPTPRPSPKPQWCAACRTSSSTCTRVRRRNSDASPRTRRLGGCVISTTSAPSSGATPTCENELGRPAAANASGPSSDPATCAAVSVPSPCTVSCSSRPDSSSPLPLPLPDGWSAARGGRSSSSASSTSLMAAAAGE
mmetsp:Transcript_10208/g.32318  ORF Transcript_10208/g.32318 Transcript_10208/m.32318 type:complete len:445 (+) Transcript_10208:1249-2583(+)